MQRKATKVKVTADHRANGYLTVGKHYNIQDDDGSYFWLEPDDVGSRIFCRWEDCHHGYEYEPVYEDTREPYWDYMLKDGEGDKEMTHKFKVGDKVRLSERGKRNYPDRPNNPYNEVGKVSLFFDGFQSEDTHYTTKVKWSNGFTNTYDEKELDLVEQQDQVNHPSQYNESGKVASDGGPSDYYDFPEGCETLNDLIEYKQMSFAQGNIFKASYRLGNKEGITLEYDLKKIKYYADRMLNQIGATKDD